MKTREQMTRVVVTLDAADSARVARHLLAQTGLRCLPVVKDGQLLGLVLARDLVEAVPDETPVLDVMAVETARVTPGTPIERVAALMLEHHVHGLPVVDAQGHLQGVITVTDLLAAMVRNPPVTLWG